MFRAVSPRTSLVAAAITVAATLAAVSSGAPAQAAPDPSKPYLSSVAYSGAGCLPGTASQTMTADQTAASFAFDSLESEVKPGEGFQGRTTSCDVLLELRAPAGVHHLAVKTDISGYMQVPAGDGVVSAGAILSSEDPRYTKEGASGVTPIHYGPYSAGYSGSDYLPITLDISPADAGVPVVVTMKVEAHVICCKVPANSARVTVDSVAVALMQQAPQEIHWDAPVALAYGAGVNVTTATSDSGSWVGFESLTPDVCGVSSYLRRENQSVYFMEPGICTLHARAEPKDLYAPATKDFSFDVYTGPISLVTSATARHILINRYILSFRAVVNTQTNGHEPGVPVSFTQMTLDGPVVRCSAVTNADGVAACDSQPVTTYYAWSSSDTNRGAPYKAVAGAGPRTGPKTVEGRVDETKVS